MIAKLDRKNLRRLAAPCAVVLILAAVLSCSAYAWFVGFKRSRTEGMEVDIPPIIYINDSNLAQMTTFDLEGLQVNRGYTEVFCVAPAYADAVDHFDLGVIYTENIGMQIDIYPVSSIGEAAGDGSLSVLRTLNDGSECYFNYKKELTPIEGIERAEELSYRQSYGGWAREDGESGGSLDESYLADHLNRGVYKKYTGFRFAHSAQMRPSNSLIDKMNDLSAYRFFVLCVTWRDNISEAELEGEADIVYIVAKGTPPSTTEETSQ